MKVLLDTTYLLPAIGIEVDLPADVLQQLFSSNHSLIINELSLFELFGKASRHMAGNQTAKGRFYIGMKSILSSNIGIKPIFTRDTLPLVRELQEKLNDLPDIPIVATAMVYADVLLTEAEDIPRLVEVEVINLTKFARRYL